MIKINEKVSYRVRMNKEPLLLAFKKMHFHSQKFETWDNNLINFNEIHWLIATSCTICKAIRYFHGNVEAEVIVVDHNGRRFRNHTS